MKYLILFLCAIPILAFSGDFDATAFMLESRSPQLSYQSQPEQPATDQSSSLKSVKKGMLFSAVVPGTGQLYQGNYWKAAAFLAVEAIGWTLYITKTSEGNDIEDEFHAYADEHWSENDYWDWISMHSGLERSNVEALRDWEHDHFSHGLHREKDQQYYEMIGKYDQFNYAWDDSDLGLLDEGFTQALRSENRLYYEDRRDASNKAFKKATTGVTLVLFNHILSAVEAAWSISRDNNQINAQLYGSYINHNHQAVPAMTLSMNW